MWSDREKNQYLMWAHAGYYYYPHFTEEETKAKEVKQLAQGHIASRQQKQSWKLGSLTAMLLFKLTTLLKIVIL